MRKPIAPCLKCEEKTEEGRCHSTCERYLNFQQEWNEYKDLVRKGVKQNAEQDAIEYTRIRKVKNGVGKRRKK